MDVVVDTNVFIYAFFNNNKLCLDILKREHNGELCFFMSNEMSEELIRVFMSQAEKLGYQLTDLVEPVKKLLRLYRRVKPFEPKNRLDISSDPDDNMFIECAVEANAEYIVSVDGHLLEIKQVIKNKSKVPIKIMTPYDFINEHNKYRLKEHFEKR